MQRSRGSLVTRGRIRPRNATRREMGQETKPKKKSESTSMRYSQPPFKDSFPILIKSTSNKLFRLDFSLDEKCEITYVRRIGYGSVLRPVYSNWYLASGRAEFLIQPAVRPYPHVFLCYTHLQLSLS